MSGFGSNRCMSGDADSIHEETDRSVAPGHFPLVSGLFDSFNDTNPRNPYTPTLNIHAGRPGKETAFLNYR